MGTHFASHSARRARAVAYLAKVETRQRERARARDRLEMAALIIATIAVFAVIIGTRAHRLAAAGINPWW